jgi:prevent-host-death family protein
MRTINIHEAKTHLSRLLEQVADGEPVIIARAGKPVAKLVPLSAKDTAAGRRLGFLAGEVSVPDDFDRMGQEAIDRLFEAGE